jgi:hypothetical protein
MDATSLQQDAEVALNLELHNKKKHEFMKNSKSNSSSSSSTMDRAESKDSGSNNASDRFKDPNIPKVKPSFFFF